MTELIYSVVPDQRAQRTADELHDQARYYRAALVDVKKATERAMENDAKGYKMDASWITHYAAKAAECQREIETLVRLARFAGLTTAQIELAASDKKIWWQTPAEAEALLLEMKK